MNKNNILNKLIKIASILDENKNYIEADAITDVMLKIAQSPMKPLPMNNIQQDIQQGIQQMPVSPMTSYSPEQFMAYFRQMKTSNPTLNWEYIYYNYMKPQMENNYKLQGQIQPMITQLVMDEKRNAAYPQQNQQMYNQMPIQQQQQPINMDMTQFSNNNKSVDMYESGKLPTDSKQYRQIQTAETYYKKLTEQTLKNAINNYPQYYQQYGASAFTAMVSKVVYDTMLRNKQSQQFARHFLTKLPQILNEVGMTNVNNPMDMMSSFGMGNMGGMSNMGGMGNMMNGFGMGNMSGMGGMGGGMMP